MIYLSQLVLNPRSRQARFDLERPYEMHRTLSRGFPDGELRAARPLFRCDERPADGASIVLVQSRQRPAWDSLVASRYLQTAPVVKEVSFCVTEGQLLSFRLLANPTVCRNGKRIALIAEADRVSWLHRKGKLGGFALGAVRIQDPQVSKTGQHGQIVIAGARFDGTLRVADPDAFVSTIESGIGPAKGLGFGLLSLARVRS